MEPRPGMAAALVYSAMIIMAFGAIETGLA